MHKLIIFCALSLWLLSEAHADSLSLITLDRSYHYDRDGGHNEKHGGLGLEYSPNEDWSYGFINYKNSFYKDTTAVHFTYKYLLLGLANGYEDAHKSMVIASNDIIIIGGLNLNLDLVNINDYSLGLRALITPSVSAIGLNLTVDLE